MNELDLQDYISLGFFITIIIQINVLLLSFEGWI